MSAVNKRTYSRIMPESTGDRIRMYHSTDIEVINSIENNIEIGKLLIGLTSGVSMTVTNFSAPEDGNNAVISGVLTDGNVTKKFTSGETLVMPLGNVGDEVLNYGIYTPASVTVGGLNPSNRQNVDQQGSAFVRFAEGSPLFDAYGSLQISRETTIGEYVPKYDNLDSDFSDVIVGGGSITHLNLSAGTLLSVGTAQNDEVKRTSDRYHIAVPGNSQLVEMSISCGDTGKTGLRRYWGYGDDNDGLFFELNESILQLRLRSSVTGLIVNTIVTQNNWNGDRLDGSKGINNLSNYNIDVSNINLYWIDFQWSTGTARLGVNINGNRIVCHTLQVTNSMNIPILRNATLPVRLVIINDGPTGSSSELRNWFIVVKSQGIYKPSVGTRRSLFVQVPLGTTYPNREVLFSMRAKQLFLGQDNRTTSYLKSMQLLITVDDAIITMVKNLTLTGATWALSPDASSAVEFDDQGSSVFTDGIDVVHSVRARDSVGDLNAGSGEGGLGDGLRRKADITQFDTFTFVGQKLSAGAGAELNIAISWDELT